MHVFVKPLHDIGKDIDMQGFRLLAIPGSKCGNIFEKPRFTDTAGLACIKRIINNIQAGEVFGNVVSVLAKAGVSVKVFNKDIIQFIAWNQDNKPDHQYAHAPDKPVALLYNPFTEQDHHLVLFL